MAGGEIRKMEWEVETSRRFVRRDFYFSRGKGQLVIETSYWLLDASAEHLKKPKFEYSRRYWLNDRSAGKQGTQTRREMQEHAQELAKDFAPNKAKFVKTRK